MGIRVATLCLLVWASCKVVDTRSDQFECTTTDDCQGGRVCVEGLCVLGAELPDADTTSPDAEVADAAVAIDAMVEFDAGAGLAIPCGPNLVCEQNCCIRNGGNTFECDVAVCNGGDLLECNDPGDCPGNNEVCCVVGSDTQCVNDNQCSLTDEVCVNDNDCGQNSDGCQQSGGDPFPTCVPE